MNIAVYCTSRYKNYPEFRDYMDACLKKYLPVGKPTALISGDYKSSDAGNGLVARYAFENNIPFRRFATLWSNHIPNKEGKKNNAGVASNAQIIKNSNGCILFWTPTSVKKWDYMSGGCDSFYKLCGKEQLARPLIPIKVDIYKPVEEEPVEEPEEPNQEIGDTGIPPDMLGASPMGGGGAPVDIGGATSSVGVGAPMPSADADGAATTVGEPLPDGEAGMDAGGEVGADANGETPSEDSLGNIDGGSTPPPTAGSLISQIPIDSNGDGTPDASVDAIDTDFNGTPDAIIKPVDTDNNGTIDKLDLEPVPTVGQLTAQNATPQSHPAVPQQTAVASAPTAAPQQQTAPQEEEQKQQQPQQ